MISFFFRIGLFFISLLSVSSCYYDSKEFLYPEIDIVCDTNSVTYSKTIAPIISENCLVCHSNNQAYVYGGKIPLEDYVDVKKRADEGSLMGALNHVKGYYPMPKGSSSKLNSCLLNSIEIWVADSTPNN